jgi:hypothetical protein
LLAAVAVELVVIQVLLVLLVVAVAVVRWSQQIIRSHLQLAFLLPSVLVVLVDQARVVEIPLLVRKVALLLLIRSLPVVVVAADIPASMASSHKTVCPVLPVVAVAEQVITGTLITMVHRRLHKAELELHG